MNRRIALAAALAAMTGSAAPALLHAQIGIKGGVSWANVDNTGAFPGDLDRRTGFSAGLSFNTRPDVLGVGIEALYAQRGVIGQSEADSRRFDYVDVPAYLRVMIPASGVAPFAYAGPQMSFEISCTTGGLDCPDSGRPSTSYAAIIGAGLMFGNRRGGFTLEGRYMYGLTDFRPSTVTSDESYRERSFLIMAGIGF